MSFFYDKPDASKYALRPVENGGEEVGFVEGLEYGYAYATKVDNADAYNELLKEQMQSIIDVIQERSGETFVNPANWYGMSDSEGGMEKNRAFAMDRVLSHIRTSPDLYPEYQDIDLDTIDQKIKQEALAEVERNKEARKREWTWRGYAGELSGTVAGTLVDDTFFELNATLARLYAPASSLWRTVMKDTILSAGTEAIMQTEVKKWYEELGLDYGYDEFVENVGAAGLLGGALPVVGRGIAITASKAKNGIKAFTDAGHISPKDADILNDMVDREVSLQERPPGVEVDNIEHLQKIEDAARDVSIGRIPGDPDAPSYDDPLPTVQDIDDIQPESYMSFIDDLADADEVVFDLPDDAGFVTMSGAQIKQEIAQDTSMLDRLRGCVIR